MASGPNKPSLASKADSTKGLTLSLTVLKPTAVLLFLMVHPPAGHDAGLSQMCSLSPKKVSGGYPEPCSRDCKSLQLCKNCTSLTARLRIKPFWRSRETAALSVLGQKINRTSSLLIFLPTIGIDGLASRYVCSPAPYRACPVGFPSATSLMAEQPDSSLRPDSLGASSLATRQGPL